MRHLQADSALPQGSHRGPSQEEEEGEEEEEEEEAAEATSRSWKPRPRGVLMGRSPSELSCQKVYQVSIFSPPAGCSYLPEQRAPGRQPVKRSCPEPQRVSEDKWDPKRGCWETGDDAIEDGLLVDALALGGTAQHFSHSGLRVVEHRQDSHADRHRWRTECSPGTAPATPQHTLCDVLHTKDYASDSPKASEPPWRPEEEEEEERLPQDEGNGVGTSHRPVRLDPELHNLAQPPSPSKRLSLGAAGLAEPGPPEGPNGLSSAEKTPCSGPRLPADGPGTCRAKRKLLPSATGVTDPGSEDESLPPARKKRALLHPVMPASCRSTDAKGAPFWNHLLPMATDSAKSNSNLLHGQLKTGLRALKPLRPFRRSLVEGRHPTSPWASATSSSRALLGNFEESMLKGRFPPSGQIEGFTAEIGASGSYCPQHATLPVEVTYFDIAEPGAPSPFLGVIDLETLGKKGYSIPKSGTLQVTLFNPNKTVVKMFLVTFDFRDMPANHITFLRHRIFLVPVGQEEQQQEAPGQPPRRVLCYLMHLRFHSSKSGKIYLHDNIRLLFSRKSIEVDSGIPYELKSFTELPRNPCYSPRA